MFCMESSVALNRLIALCLRSITEHKTKNNANSKNRAFVYSLDTVVFGDISFYFLCACMCARVFAYTSIQPGNCKIQTVYLSCHYAVFCTSQLTTISYYFYYKICKKQGNSSCTNMILFTKV